MSNHMSDTTPLPGATGEGGLSALARSGHETLDLAFRADDEAEARSAATDWIEAEPAVAHGRIVGVERERDSRWIVAVELGFWPSFEQGELGLSA